MGRRRDRPVPTVTEEPRTERRYKVIGRHPVAGVKPGGYVTLKLTASGEHRMRHNLERAPETPAKPKFEPFTTDRPIKAVDEKE